MLKPTAASATYRLQFNRDFTFDAAREIDGRDPIALYGRGLSRLAMGQGGQKDMDMAMGYDKNIAAFFKANDLYP